MQGNDESLRKKASEGSRPNQIKVRLIIYGFSCAADEVSEILELTPTRTWKAGDLVAQSKVVLKHNGWLLQAPIDAKACTFEEAVTSLARLVLPKKDRFSGLPFGSQVEFSCVVYDYDGSVCLGFSKDDIHVMCAIGAYVDIDYNPFWKEDSASSKSGQT